MTTADEIMMGDAELRTVIEGAKTSFDPAFRVRVLQRICERAHRRAMLRRAALWIATGFAAGLVAQALTPPESGWPSLEFVAMAISVGAAALVLATAAAVVAPQLLARIRFG